MANRTKRIDQKRAKFLARLVEGASIHAAATAAGIGRTTAYEWRDAEPEFAAAWDEAVEAGTDALEDEAIRRARSGVDEPVYYQGEKVGVVRRYSDTLLIFMLKARRPDKFKERPVRLRLPDIASAQDILKAHAAAIEAMARGEITLAEAATIASVLETKRKAFETVQLEERVATLEQRGTNATLP
jgi:hypothetical protein